MMRKYQVRFGGGPMEKDWRQTSTSPTAYPTLYLTCKVHSPTMVYEPKLFPVNLPVIRTTPG
jgi:hypothetical protein